MRCKRAESLFSLYMENELEKDLLNEVKFHLEGCKICSRAYRQFVKSIGIIKDLDEIKASPFLEKKLITIVTAESSLKQDPIKRFNLQKMLIPAFGFGIALILISTFFIKHIISVNNKPGISIIRNNDQLSPIHVTSTMNERDSLNKELYEALTNHHIKYFKQKQNYQPVEYTLDFIETNKPKIRQVHYTNEKIQTQEPLYMEVDLEYVNEPYLIPVDMDGNDEFATGGMELIPASNNYITY